MPISDLSSAQIKNLLRLLREKESLQTKLARVKSALAKLDGNATKPNLKGSRKPNRRTGTTIKDSILEVLAQAGPGGLSVKEIATQASANAGSVSVWIYTSGKKISGLKKIAPGRYVYQKR